MAITYSDMTRFIEKIGPIVQKYAKEYGYKYASPIIAQACCESAYGTSTKAKHHNYFGLKYRDNRCPSSSGTFVDGSKEQLANGKLVDIKDKWFDFETMEDGVKGYFEFISISNYSNLKKATSPKDYLTKLREDKYCTSLTYVDTNYRIIVAFSLTKFDNFTVEEKKDKKKEEKKKEVEQPVTTKKETTKKEEKKETEVVLKIGDKVKLTVDTYYDGKKIPLWVKKSTLYYRGENTNGLKFSTKKNGSITGVVKVNGLKKVAKA